MRQGGHVAAPGCERDTRGGFTKSGPGDSQNCVPRSFFLSVSYGPEPRVGVAAPGDRRWTGATPPFCCPQRARGRCAIHICATPPGGVAPVQIIPGGKAKTKNEDRVDLSPQTPLWRLNPWRLTLPPANLTLVAEGPAPPNPPDAKRHIPTKELSKEGSSFVWTTSPPYGKSKISHRVLRFASSSVLPPISPAQPVPFALAPGSPEPGVACDDGQNPIPDPSQTRFSPIQTNWRACFFTISREFPPEAVSRDLSAGDRFAPTGKLARGTHSYGTRQTKAPGSAPEG